MAKSATKKPATKTAKPAKQTAPAKAAATKASAAPKLPKMNGNVGHFMADALVVRVGITKKAATEIVRDMTGAVADAMKKGKVTWGEIGTFAVAKRGKRTAVNPNTRERVDVPAHKTVRFRATPALRKF